MRKVDTIDSTSPHHQSLIHCCFHVLDSLFRVTSSFLIKDYINDTKNFLLYSMKIKRKKNEKEEQANTNVPNKDDVDQKLIHRDDQPKKVSSEERNLLKLKAVLE